MTVRLITAEFEITGSIQERFAVGMCTGERVGFFLLKGQNPAQVWGLKHLYIPPGSLTGNAPEKLPKPNRKPDRLPTIIFQGLC